MRAMTFYIAVIVILIISSGCSMNGASSVYTNDVSNLKMPQDSIPVGVTDLDSSGAAIAGMSTLGLFNLHVNPLNASAELTQLRQNSLSDVLEVVDITNFLSLAPCTNCAKIKGIALDTDGNPVVTIGIRHPFEPGDPLKPITGRNRADLHVFNIEGIVISSASTNSFPGIDESIAGFKLINADGFTGYLDGVLDEIYPTDATIHPYIMHFDDYSVGNFDPANPMGFLSVTNPPPWGNLVMAMGCDYDYKDYIFAIDQPFDFIYAVGCTYAVSAGSKSLRFSPEYRIPQHNKKAASEVSVAVASNELRAGDISSEAELEIHVVDINHGVEVGEALNQMLADSSVGTISIDIPGVTSSPVVINGNSNVSGTGHDPSDPLIYRPIIINSAGGDIGIYEGLVKVLDTYMPGQNGSPLLNSMDGIERVDPLMNPLTGLFTIDEFATYQIFEIEVSESCVPPVPTSIEPDTFGNNETYQDVLILGSNFTGSGGVTDVYLDNGVVQIHATDINVVSDTELNCDFQFSNEDIGLYDVVVFTACEGRADNLAELAIGEWSCYQYNSYNIGQNPVPQGFDYQNYVQKWFTVDTGLKYSGPAVTKDYAYTTTNDSFYSSPAYHRLTCFDITNGAIVWQKLINPTGDYARSHTSPCWYDDGENGRVVVGGDRVWCFDAVTGAQEWEYGLSYVFIGASPKIWDDKVFIAGSGFVHGIDVMTGAGIWISASGTGGGESTPAVVDGRVYIGAGYEPNAVYSCLDVADGHTIWQKTNMPTTSHWNAPLVIDGRVYYASYNRWLTCMNAEDGAIIWQYTESGGAAWITSLTTWIDPSDSKRIIYFGGAFSGGLIAVKDNGASPSLFWRSSSSFYSDASPVYNDGIIYVGDVYGNALYGYDCATGTQVFTRLVSNSIRGAVGFAYGRMIVPTSDGVYCFE